MGLLYPLINDCKPGLWVQLSNGWIIGPIVKTELSGIYVEFGNGMWQVDIIDQIDLHTNPSRLVISVGTRKDLIISNT